MNDEDYNNQNIENNSNIEDTDFDTYTKDDEEVEILYNNDEEIENVGEPHSFGEKEHNEARDENNHYDRNYYENRQKELDKNVVDAKNERDRNFKMTDGSEGDPVKSDGSNTIHKNALDKANDKINYAKAKKNQIGNKIANAKNKVYMATHPSELLEEKADDLKDNLKNKVKSKLGVPKDGKDVVKKAAVGVGKAVLSIFKNPLGIMILAIFAFFIFIIFMFLMFFSDGSSGDKRIGLYGYDYYENTKYPNCTDIEYKGEPMTIDEYAARVIAAEVGGFSMETLKAFAVAARTFVIAMGERHERLNGTCYIDASNVLQSYSDTEVNEIHRQAADETKGLIITVDNVPRGNYDASCVYTAEQAQEVDLTGNFSENYYYIGYGKATLGNLYFQPIEKDKIDIGTLRTYVNAAINGNPCSGNNGNGMSQNGAFYLEKYNNYTWKEIIDYYYQGKAEIKSLYHTYEVTNNWMQVVTGDARSSIPTKGLLTSSIRRLMSEKEYNDFNEMIKTSVINAGVGTRDAIVNVAVLPIKTLAENFEYVIPYSYGGGHGGSQISSYSGLNIERMSGTYYGINPDWGTPLSNKRNNYGPDCTAWLLWVFKNAGITGVNYGAYADRGTKQDMGNGFVASPGDVIERRAIYNSEGTKIADGHVMLIVGVDEEKGVYYISHANGTGSGVVITTKKIDGSDCYKCTSDNSKCSKCYVVDMSKYLEEHVNSNYETDFTNGVIPY